MTFPFDHRAVHLSIDMQRLFAEPSPWHMPWMPRVLPGIVARAPLVLPATMIDKSVYSAMGYTGSMPSMPASASCCRSTRYAA
jgi:hypothetical protein